MSKKEKPKFTEADIEKREWRHGIHLPLGPRGTDLHLIKEVVTLKDGRQFPNMRVLPNFERPIWALKPQYRTYQDKKEYEHESRLDRIMVREHDLRNKVAMLTGNPSSPRPIKELLASPYIYGADIPSTAIIHRYLYQKPNMGKDKTPYKMGSFDTETDVLYGTGEIIIGSMTILPDVHLVIRRDFLQCPEDQIESRFRQVMLEKLGPEIKEYELNLTYEMVDTEIEIVEKSFKWFHERQPDWMAIWHIDFDATKILEACERAKVNPLQILSDPGIPYEYRICKYKRALTNKKAASGKGKPVSPHDQWNFMHLTASFVMVDAMSAYRLLRLGEQEERSYSLDAILEKEFGDKIRKLKHPPADMYVKEKWHQVMQKDHKFVYLAYAAMDTISMCLLDKKTRDLSHKLPSMADITDFSQCNSQPKRLRDAFFVFALEDHQSVIGSVGKLREFEAKEDKAWEVDLGDIVDEDGFSQDDEIDEVENFTTLDRKGWTLTLASHLSAPGLPLMLESTIHPTGIRCHVYDSDAVSSYPSCTQVANVSKVTTRKEICKVGDLPELTMRMSNLNLMFSPTNSISYTTDMFKAPKLTQLLQMYDQQH